MKTKIFKTFLFVVLFIGGSGLFKYLKYTTDMGFAKVAPQQFDDYSDAAYDALQMQDTVSMIVNVGFIMLCLVIGWALYSVWKPKKEKETKE